MSDDKELRIVVRIRNQAQRALSKLGTTMKKLGGFAKVGAAAFLGMGIAAGILVVKMVQLANAQEKAETRLRTVVVSMGRFRESADTLVPKILDVASAIQAQGVATDEAVIEGAAFLATYQQISDEALPRAMEVMADMALLTGDMTTAANKLGKASMGMVGELREVGITIDPIVAASGDFNLILEAISEQIGEQQKQMRKTGYGGLIGFKNQLSDTLEVGGKVIMGVFGPVAEAAARAMATLNKELRDFVESDRFKEWAKKTVPIVAWAFEKIVQAIGGAVQGGLAFLGTLAEIYKTYITLRQGMASAADDAQRRDIKMLEEQRKAWQDYHNAKAGPDVMFGGDADPAAPAMWTAEHQQQLEDLRTAVDGNYEVFAKGNKEIQKTEKFIDNMAGAFHTTGQATDTFVNNFRTEMDAVMADIDDWDLTGRPTLPGGTEPGDPKALKAAQSAATALQSTYRDAQLAILERTEGDAAAAEARFQDRLTQFNETAKTAMAQGILDKAEVDDMRMVVQQNHDELMEEMNRNHWERILEDQEAALNLGQQQWENFNQGTTDAVADAISDSVMGIKGGEKKLLAAMGGLIGGIAQQWGDYYVLKGVATIAEGGWPPNPAAITAGMKTIAAGTALKVLGGVLGKATSGGGGDSGGGGGGGPDVPGDVPGAGSQAPQKNTVIEFDFGQMRADDVILDGPAFIGRVIDEINDGFARNVTVIGEGGATAERDD